MGRCHPSKGAGMKRIDYFWPRTTTKITGIVFISQILTNVLGFRNPEFDWVLLMCGLLFMSAIVWTLYAVVMNAIRARGQA